MGTTTYKTYFLKRTASSVDRAGESLLPSIIRPAPLSFIHNYRRTNDIIIRFSSVLVCCDSVEELGEEGGR